MKQFLASRALLTRQLPVLRNHTIANRALCLAFHGRIDVLAPCLETVNKGAFVSRRRKIDYSLRRHDPRMPFLFVDGDTVDGVDRGAGERVGWRKADGDLHKLVIDGDAGIYFASGGGDFDDEGWFRCGLGGGPFADGIEF